MNQRGLSIMPFQYYLYPKSSINAEIHFCNIFLGAHYFIGGRKQKSIEHMCYPETQSQQKKPLVSERLNVCNSLPFNKYRRSDSNRHGLASIGV